MLDIGEMLCTPVIPVIDCRIDIGGQLLQLAPASSGVTEICFGQVRHGQSESGRAVLGWVVGASRREERGEEAGVVGTGRGEMKRAGSGRPVGGYG